MNYEKVSFDSTIQNDMARTMKNIGSVYGELLDNGKAEFYIKKASEIYKKSVGVKDDLFASTILALGGAYFWQHDYTNSIKCFKQAANIYKLNKSYNSYYSALNNLATTYSQVGDLDLALIKFKEIENSNEFQQYSLSAATLYMNKAGLYHRMDDVKLMIEYYQKLEIFKYRVGNKSIPM